MYSQSIYGATSMKVFLSCRRSAQERVGVKDVYAPTPQKVQFVSSRRLVPNARQNTPRETDVFRAFSDSGATCMPQLPPLHRISQEISGADQIFRPESMSMQGVFRNLERNMALRAPRRAHKRHRGFLGSTVAFLHVALQAGRDHVIPGIPTAPGAGNDVVDSQVVTTFAAILARVIIPVQNVAPG